MNIRALKNLRKHRKRSALNNSISEIEVPVTQHDATFDVLLARVRPQLDEHIQQALRQHGYD